MLSPEQQLEIVKNELDQIKETRKQSHRRFYANKFKYYPDMNENERAKVKANIDKRNAQARARYQRNKEQREKQKERAREYAKKKRMEKNNSGGNTSLDSPSSQVQRT